MADRGQWRGAFFALGAVGVLYALPYFAFLRRVEEPQADKAATTAGITFYALGRSRTFLLLCFVFPVFVFGLWLLYGWLPTFLREKFELTQADAAFNATVYLQATTAVGLLGGGFLADALYRRTKASRLWLMTASLILCAPCLHYLGSSETMMATRIAAAGFGLFSGLLIGNIFPAAFEVVPADTRASAVGILNFFGAIMSGFAALFGLEDGVGGGHLHRLLLGHEHAVEVSDDEGEDAGHEQGGQGHLRDLAEEFDLVALPQVPGGNSQDHERTGSRLDASIQRSSCLNSACATSARPGG